MNFEVIIERYVSKSIVPIVVAYALNFICSSVHS